MTDKQKRQNHAAAVLEQLEALAASVENHDAGLWFGGYPPLFIQVQNLATHLSEQIRSTFELPEESEEE